VVFSKKEQDLIIEYVKKEPRLIQDIALHIGKSWVTAESYVDKVVKDTGLLNVKVFRPGTKGAVKVVFWNYSERSQAGDMQKRLFDKVNLYWNKKDFDPLEVFQWVDPKKRNSAIEYYDESGFSKESKIGRFLLKANEEVLCFSGNLSFINVVEGKSCVLNVLKELLERGVVIKVICRIDLASMKNINELSKLINKYPKQLEIRHCRQPVRGFVVDGSIARLKSELQQEDYRPKELTKNARAIYEFSDTAWVDWLKGCFWHLFRNSIGYQERVEALESALGN